jgi:hypothetical protein
MTKGKGQLDPLRLAPDSALRLCDAAELHSADQLALTWWMEMEPEPEPEPTPTPTPAPGQPLFELPPALPEWEAAAAQFRNSWRAADAQL